jgi:hypothetical protein
VSKSALVRLEGVLVYTKNTTSACTHNKDCDLETSWVRCVLLTLAFSIIGGFAASRVTCPINRTRLLCSRVYDQSAMSIFGICCTCLVHCFFFWTQRRSLPNDGRLTVGLYKDLSRLGPSASCDSSERLILRPRILSSSSDPQNVRTGSVRLRHPSKLARFSLSTSFEFSSELFFPGLFIFIFII